ncbi:hypothetical protein PIB30_098513, partial [Stylosanthes scabra]|nr:hypothetical protein [Stylosanthes scabra]
MLFEGFRGGSCVGNLGLDRTKSALYSSVACSTCIVQNPPFLFLFMNPLLPMPSLAFPMHFSIPKALNVLANISRTNIAKVHKHGYSQCINVVFRLPFGVKFNLIELVVAGYIFARGKSLRVIGGPFGLSVR